MTEPDARSNDATATRIALIGVSGPDGAGKSTLVADLAVRLARDSRPVRRLYAYGCVVCRRLPASAGVRLARAGGGGSGDPDRGARRPRAGRVGARLVREVHAVVDAAELALRLWVARVQLRAAVGRHRRRAGGPGARPVLLTDRSPLDGLVKHAPRPDSPVDRLYGRVARRYDLLILLEGRDHELAARDHEHGAAELADLAARFALAARRLPNVRVIGTADRSAADVAGIAEDEAADILA